jgi:hypothetical protein
MQVVASAEHFAQVRLGAMITIDSASMTTETPAVILDSQLNNRVMTFLQIV